MEIDIVEELAGIQSENDRIRERHFEILLPVSKNTPEKLYPYWDTFVEMLRKPEVSNKYYAIHFLTYLCSVDSENKFEKIFDEFFILVNHESPVVSGHIADKAGIIVSAKPKLSEMISDILLNVEDTSKCKQLELQKAYIISSLNFCYDNLNKKNEVMKFVEKQLNSKSPKTRKAAKQFLDKFKK